MQNMKEKIHIAKHDGTLVIGDMKLPCSVLEDGTRVLTQTEFMNSMGMYYSGWISKNKAKDKATADESGERKNKLHQWLNDDIGNPMLAQHLHTIIVFQKQAILNGHSWGRFLKSIDQVMPKQGNTLELILPDENF